MENVPPSSLNAAAAVSSSPSLESSTLSVIEGSGLGTQQGNKGRSSSFSLHPLLQGSRSVDHFERLSHIDEGTYGKV